jgi:hypothetical protein
VNSLALGERVGERVCHDRDGERDQIDISGRNIVSANQGVI